MKQKMRLFLFALLVFMLPLGSVEAQLKPSESTDNQGPISISSDKMEANDNSGIVTFIGQVIARQGTMTLSSDIMKIHYIKTEQSSNAKNIGAENSQIDRVECEGNVKIIDGDRLAVGNKALYLAASEPRRVILTGDARIWQGRDSLTGHEVVYYLDDGRSTAVGQKGNAKGSRQRVRTIYHQGDKE